MNDDENSNRINLFSNEVRDGYSDDEKEEENPVFHYERGSFRKREQKLYSDMATGASSPKRGFFRVLVGTKSNRMMFLVMVIVFAVVFALSLFMNKPNEGSTPKVSMNLTAFSFDDKVYASLELNLSSKYKAELSGSKQSYFGLFRNKKTEVKEEYKLEKPVLVTASFSGVDSDGNVSNTVESSLLFDGTDDYIRITMEDYDVTVMSCTVDCEDTKTELKAKVTRR